MCAVQLLAPPAMIHFSRKTMKYRNMSRQSGFTLVEIAIVLVIIGLLLGGVLKGQEMIENGKIKSVVGDMKAVQSAYHSYVDRYHAVPGDEAAAAMTARGWTGTAGATGTAGDGVMVIPVASTFTNLAANDQPAVWRALRGAGLLSGDPAAAAGVASLPAHSAGGTIGVTAGPAYGLPGPVVCASGLSTKQAAGIDALLDGAGAENNTGSLRGLQAAANPLAPAAAAAAAATAYNETTANKWTVCMKI